MQNELKEKLQNLNEKFNTDLDVISLKALCNMPESDEISFAIAGTLNRLIEKYPDDKEILGLLPKKEKISLESLIEALQETYPNNTEVLTIKALSTFPEEELREKAIAQSLERLLEINPNDDNIAEYLEIEEIVSKEQNPDMVFIEGGSYIPSFVEEIPSFIERDSNDEKNFEDKCNNKINVCDLYISKYQVTQVEWKKYISNNNSSFKGERRPVENITWIEALEFCNKMSENYGLQPVYKIENKKLTKIIYKNAKEVYPDLADFSKVEGYRLPTEVEWEWFARGGKKAIENRTFNTKYAGSDDIEEVAWCAYNSEYQTHTVGTKKPNALGLYDCTGNIDEWCYDTDSKGYISNDKPYIYDESVDERIIKGGSWIKEDDSSYVADSFHFSSSYEENTIGFRIVRTAIPKK